MFPLGMIEPRVQPLTPVFTLREMLEQKTARFETVRITPDRDPHEAGDLLGLGKIALRCVG